MVHYPLHPDTPKNGITLEKLFAGRDYDIKGSFKRMKALTEAEGLPYGQRTHSYNSRLAQELGTWADTQEHGANLHMKIYQAYFVNNQNVADIEVLVGLAQSANLDIREARRIMVEGTFKNHVDADWAKSREYGVTGIPTYVAAGAGIVGAQPFEALEQLIVRVGGEKR